MRAEEQEKYVKVLQDGNFHEILDRILVVLNECTTGIHQYRVSHLDFFKPKKNDEGLSCDSSAKDAINYFSTLRQVAETVSEERKIPQDDIDLLVILKESLTNDFLGRLLGGFRLGVLPLSTIAEANKILLKTRPRNTSVDTLINEFRKLDNSSYLQLLNSDIPKLLEAYNQSKFLGKKHEEKNPSILLMKGDRTVEIPFNHPKYDETKKLIEQPLSTEERVLTYAPIIACWVLEKGKPPDSKEIKSNEKSYWQLMNIIQEIEASKEERRI